MSKKLYFYSLCLTVVYIVFFVHSAYEMGQFGLAGFKLGYNDGRQSELEHHVVGNYIIPIEGSATFPSTFINKKTGEEVRLEIRQVLAYVTKSPESVPFYVKLAEIMSLVLVFILLALFIYLPFVVFRIMKSITKDEFYSVKNIKRIKKTSFILLGIFLISLITNISNVITTNAYMQMENYEAYLGDLNYSLLFLGLITLILSEILRYTTTIKEEQDLTI
jgi:Protein of unknown function (DUF2975).